MRLRLSQLQTFLLKSAAATSHTEPVEVGLRGFENDRRFCLVHPDGSLVTQRRYPKLAVVQAAVEGRMARFGIEGFGSTKVDMDSLTGNASQLVKLHDDQVTGIDAGNEVAQMFSDYLELGAGCRMVSIGEERRIMEGTDIPCNLQDGYAFSLLSKESVAEFNRRFVGQNVIPAEQFRMSLVIEDLDGRAAPNFEDRIRRMRIRDVEFVFAKRTPRCTMVNVSQATGWVDRRVLGTLSQKDYRFFPNVGNPKTWFGTYFAHHGVGKIGVGDMVEVLEWQDAPKK